MFRLLFLMNECRPSVMAKRFTTQMYYMRLGNKLRKNALKELLKNRPPAYKTPDALFNELNK